MRIKARILFFIEQQDRPVTFYEIMHLAGVETVARHVRELIEAGRLEVVNGRHYGYLRLANG